MTSFLYRLGRSCATHPWRVIGAWILLIATVIAMAASFGAPLRDDWDVPGARAQHGLDLMREHGVGGYASARVVVHDRSGDALPTTELAELTTRLQDLEHVAEVSPARVSADRDTAVLTVQYAEPITHPDLMGNVKPLEGAIAGTIDDGYQVELGGDLPDTAGEAFGGTGELIGVGIALLILVIAFGSAVGAGLPIGVAVAGLTAGVSGITLLAATTDVSTSAPTVASMVGLGVGIDYALLLVVRHVEHLRQGHDVVESAARAVATAGRSVAFAAGVVLVSLMGLRLAGLSTYDTFGLATAIAVVCVAAARSPWCRRCAGSGVARCCLAPCAGTVPCPRVSRSRPAGQPGSDAGRSAGRWPASACCWCWPHPCWACAPGRATPAASRPRRPPVRPTTWSPPSSGRARTRRSRSSCPPPPATRPPERSCARCWPIPGSPGVEPVVSTPDGHSRSSPPNPAFGPADERTPGMIADLRADLPRGAEVTGWTPFFSDISAMLQHRLWLVIAFVVGVSVILLGLMFRSVLVPLKAAVVNLLSISAAYGVLVAVFQWGWGAELIGVDRPVPVSSWMPILQFAVLFGLSMDYEVFLLSRIREDYLRTGDPRGSVVRGLAATGRVISSGAAIMVVVFLGFATEADVVVKQLGIGMAAAVLLDATLVRMVLVPSTMALLGHLNWWMPGWLDRRLPHLDVEDAGAPSEEPVLVGAR